MVNISSKINAKKMTRSPFSSLMIGSFLMSSDLRHVGIKMSSSSIRWFPNTPDEYASHVAGMEYIVGEQHIYTLPANVHLEVTL